MEKSRSFSRSVFVAGLIYSVFGLLLLGGILSPYRYNHFPADRVIDVALIIGALFLASSINRKVFYLFFASIVYVSLSYLYAVIYRDVNILDFMLAYKAYFFIVIISLYVKKNVFKLEFLSNCFNFVLVLFFIKYSYSILLDLTPRMGNRPGLFVENNFELIFLCLYFYLVRDRLDNKIYSFVVLVAVVLMSGSRSAILVLGVVYASVFIKSVNRYTFLHILAFSVLAVAGAIVISSRTEGGLEAIDRFRFLTVFFEETKSWSVVDYVFGSPRITALSEESCLQLSFYEALMSFSGEEATCYSVILHSYWLRAVFDHGFIGIIFLLLFLRNSLYAVGFSRRDFWTVCGVLLLSGLSVSSFNSTFVALTLVIYVGGYSGSCSNAGVRPRRLRLSMTQA